MKLLRTAPVAIALLATLSACSDDGDAAATATSKSHGATQKQPKGEGGAMNETKDVLVTTSSEVPLSGVIVFQGDRFAGEPGACSYGSVTLTAIDPDTGDSQYAYAMTARNYTRDSMGASAGPDTVRLCGPLEPETHRVPSGPAMPTSPDLKRHAAVTDHSVGWVGMDAVYHVVADTTKSANQFDPANNLSVDSPWFDRSGAFYYLQTDTQRQDTTVFKVDPDGTASPLAVDGFAHLDPSGEPSLTPDGTCLGADLAWLSDTETITSGLLRVPATELSDGSCRYDYSRYRDEKYGTPLVAGNVGMLQVKGAAVSPEGHTLAFGSNARTGSGFQLYTTSLDAVEQPTLVKTYQRLGGATVLEWIPA